MRSIRLRSIARLFLPVEYSGDAATRWISPERGPAFFASNLS